MCALPEGVSLWDQGPSMIGSTPAESTASTSRIYKLTPRRPERCGPPASNLTGAPVGIDVEEGVPDG